MPRILQAVGNLSAKAQLTAQAQHYREQLKERFPDSEEARQLAAHTVA
jgi:Tfp pilus assembly protein PilF